MRVLALTTKDEKTALEWHKSLSKNQDPYGWAVLEVVSKLGAALDDGLAPARAEKVAIKDSGITGFQAGAMANMIWRLHPRGEEFKLYWNRKFGQDKDGKAQGVVNPAIMTVKTK